VITDHMHMLCIVLAWGASLASGGAGKQTVTSRSSDEVPHEELHAPFNL